MVDNNNKTKTAMLTELESIKGLLQEEDDIPILQEVIDADPAANLSQRSLGAAPAARAITEQQQDFFAPPSSGDNSADLLASLNDLEAKTAVITAGKAHAEAAKPARPSLAKATGENPFLPEHIRARLHGNNPPPLFAAEAAKKIARSSRPTTQLGSFSMRSQPEHSHSAQQDIIDSIIARIMPELELELRERLELMSREMLDELNKH